MPHRWRPAAPPATIAIGLAALVGLALGAVRAHWQDAVEPSQVLAGVVRYTDTTNPFYLYQTKAGTLLHVLGAAALRAGLDEAALSTLISASIGGLSFAAIAAWAWALTRSLPAAVAAPPVLAYADLTDWGLRYPLQLLDTGFTYGAVGLATAAFALGLVAAGHARAGGLLAGLAPAVHLVVGGWAVVVLAAGLVCRPSLLEERGRLLRGLLAGVFISAAFFAAHFARAGFRAVGEEAGLAAAYLAQRLANDEQGGFHQGPLDPAWPQVLFLLVTLALALAWLSAFGERLSATLRTALHLHVVLVVLGFLVAGMHTILGEASPAPLVISMPCRFLNLAVLSGTVTLLGLLWNACGHCLASAVLVALIAAGAAVRAFDSPMTAMLMLRAASLAGLALACLGTRWFAAPARALTAAAVPLALVALDGYGHGADPTVGIAAGVTLLVMAVVAVRGPANERPVPPRRRSATVAALAIALASSVAVWRRPEGGLDDPRQDAALRSARGGSGTLVTACGLVHGQRLTRRPLLLDTEQLDMLPYVLETAPRVSRILERVYGRGLLDRPPADCRAVWEARTREEWAQVAAELAFTEILAFPDWRLNLPEIARGERYVLYRASAR